MQCEQTDIRKRETKSIRAKNKTNPKQQTNKSQQQKQKQRNKVRKLSAHTYMTVSMSWTQILWLNCYYVSFVTLITQYST